MGKQKKSWQIACCTWHVSENVIKISKTDSNETIKECCKQITPPNSYHPEGGLMSSKKKDLAPDEMWQKWSFALENILVCEGHLDLANLHHV